jgi:sulfatase maturation enzyme AslB (radical SAM superfamily)
MTINSTPKSFCILPWIHSFINTNGNYQVCCISEEYHPGIPDQNNNLFNINNHPSLDDVMNSDFMRNLRLEMINGQWNPICTRCLETESSGGVSRRQIENSEYVMDANTYVNETKQNGQIDVKFKSIDYRLGNLCNLQCRMCGPHSSSLWINDWNLVKPVTEHISDKQKLVLENYDWIDQISLLDEFKSKLNFVDRLHFAGGEPLIAPQMVKMLKICVDMGIAQNITLSYNTNITQLPTRVLDLWKHFKSVKLLCSIDGFGKVNDYIRFPSKWNIIDKNLFFLDKNYKNLNISEIILSCTVQIYNVLELSDLYNYLKKFKNIVPALNLINLHHPHYMTTKLLPVNAKKKAAEQLIEIAAELEPLLPEWHQYLRENIFQAIRFMNQEDHTSELSHFKKINSNIDKKKGMSLQESIPALNLFLINHFLDKIS